MRIFTRQAAKPVLVRHDFLFTYTELPPTPLEVAESIDMLRVLEHGYAVRLVESPYVTLAVDTPADLAKVEEYMRGDASLLEASK